MRLKNKCAVLVGGGVGWGAAASEKFANEGADVIIIGASDDKTVSLIRRITDAGGRARHLVAEIGSERELGAIALQLQNERKKVDVLVTHYMDMEWNSIEQCSIESFTRVIQHNLVGPVIATKCFLPLIKQDGGGSIVHIGSVDGLNGNPRLPSYSAAKGGLVPLTKLMAFEFAKYDIRVNLIATAQTIQIAASEMPDGSQLGFKNFPGYDYMRQLNEATPLKRSGSLVSWAGSVLFLASDDAAHVTGSVLVVDCGRLAITPGTA